MGGGGANQVGRTGAPVQIKAPPENRQKSGLFWAWPFMHPVCTLVVILEGFAEELFLVNVRAPILAKRRASQKPQIQKN